MLAGQAQAVDMLGYDGGADELYSIDTAMPSAASIGTDPSIGFIAEIEYGDGVVYAADTGTNSNLHLLDPGTGLVTSTLTMTFPVEGDVLTSLEFVGDTLYGGLTSEGGGPTYLSTIDLGTGAVTVVGPTGFGSPFGGLAYDGSTMYGVSDGGSAAELFTVDLGSGSATSVGLITIPGAALSGTTGLEFESDGVLYALPNNRDALTGHLLSIDPATAEATDLGDLGVAGMNALTTPEPSTLALLGLAGLLGCWAAGLLSPTLAQAS
jgi:hypothetical protein